MSDRSECERSQYDVNTEMTRLTSDPDISIMRGAFLDKFNDENCSTAHSACLNTFNPHKDTVVQTRLSPNQNLLPSDAFIDAQISMGEAKSAAFGQISLAEANYLGVLSMEKAENSVKRICTFALYHPVKQPAKLNYSHSVGLHIVYRVSDGTYRHYMIDSNEMDGSSWFHVRCGRQPRFPSLDSLIRYYRTYVGIWRPKGKCFVDVFPPSQGIRLVY